MGKRIDDGAKELARSFGRLVATHRRRVGWTQERLASEADISEAMIAKIETGATGARFPMIVRLAQALRVDPVELFYEGVPKGRLQKGPRRDLMELMNELDENQIVWVHELLAVALRVYAVGGKSPGRPKNPSSTVHSGNIHLRKHRKRSN